MKAPLPTYQTFSKGGQLNIYLQNKIAGDYGITSKTNIGGIPIGQTVLHYGRSTAKKWPEGKGKQWQFASGSIPSIYMTMPPNASGATFNVGAGYYLHIQDRSSVQVADGVDYIFHTDLSYSLTQIRLVLIIVGFSGGSILYPGFGLFNLKSKPGQWSYVYSPRPFNKDWSIEVNSPYFTTPYTLSASYINEKTDTSGNTVGGVLFGIEGIGLVTNLLGPLGATSLSEDLSNQEKNVPLELLSDESTYERIEDYDHLQ